MDELEEFWSMVHLAQVDRGAFEAKLHQLDQGSLVNLYKMYQDAVSDLKGDEYWQHLQGMSEDAIDDIAYRIVEQGNDYYSSVVAHPELIKAKITVRDLGFDARGTIMQVYVQRFGEPLWRRLSRGGLT